VRALLEVSHCATDPYGTAEHPGKVRSLREHEAKPLSCCWGGKGRSSKEDRSVP